MMRLVKLTPTGNGSFNITIADGSAKIVKFEETGKFILSKRRMSRMI